jgi:hydrogenase nickel incorporation protein HypA/HybF
MASAQPACSFLARQSPRRPPYTVPPKNGGFRLGLARLRTRVKRGVRMHELSIAMSIVEMAEEESEQRGGARVNAVYLKLGALAGVVKAALLSSYEIACEGTGLQGSRLLIEEIPIVVHCPQCLAPRTLDSPQWFVCPECKGPVSEVIQGRELQVYALELQE